MKRLIANTLKCCMSVLVGALVAGTAGTAQAGPLWEFSTAGNSFSNGTWNFATSFAVNKDLSVSGLGYYADPSNGQVADNAVALYLCSNADCTGTGTLVASTIVTNAYPLLGHFRYVTIAPVTLLAGQSYQVAGVSAGDNYTWGDAGFATDSGISLIALNGQVGRWESGTTAEFLNYGQGDLGALDGYWGANVFVGEPTFTEVPEPSELALFGLGLVIIGSLTIRRRRA